MKRRRAHVGTPIRHWREFRGLTQQELADRMGRSLRTVIRWEMGDSFPGSHDLLRLVEILSVPPDYLVPPTRTDAAGRAARPARP